jgi:pimeloyl-ACP methyl ester carboxylesterase/DNA-binding winged helix-turn-helix (wHTH) protein
MHDRCLKDERSDRLTAHGGQDQCGRSAHEGELVVSGGGQATGRRFRVGGRWVTPDANDIDGARVEAKSMDVLVALADAAPSVVSSAALLDRVWPDVVVVDNVVYQAVAQLRKAFGDDAHAPRYIENIPRRGYRLIAEIEREASGGGEPPATSIHAVSDTSLLRADVGSAEEQALESFTHEHAPVDPKANGSRSIGAAPVVGAEPRDPGIRSGVRIGAFVALMFVVAGLGFANRTDIGVWLALHVAPITSRPIDQHIGFATTTDGVRIAYATSGAGPPLVLAIGWFTHLKNGLSSPNYDSAGQLRWYSRDHLVVRYDGRGFGLSDRNVTEFSLDARVRDLEAVVDALGLKHFALCGMSAGGPTVLTYTARHPDRVSRLVLLGTLMGPFAIDAKWAERYAAFARMWEFVRTDWQQPASRAAVVEWMHPKASEVERRVLMELMRTSADGPTFANFMSFQTDAADAARQVRAPTLVVAGSEDSELPPTAGVELAAAIPGARFEILEGKDHFEAIGNDPQVLQMVSAFLAEDSR